MSGMIQGGWEYVNASYLITLVTLVGYAVYVTLRLRAANREEA